MRAFLALAALLVGPVWGQSLGPLERVAAFAETLQAAAPKVLAEEILEQHTLVVEGGLRVRIGAAAIAARPVRDQSRRIVSEFTFAPLEGWKGGSLVEFRQVVSVDGFPAQSAGAARHALSLGVNSPDERVRKRMLEDFASHGLEDLATDYSLILLAFTSRGQQSLAIDALPEEFVGAEACLLYSWHQTSAASGGALMFAGREAAREALAGRLWARKRDGLPLRVSAEVSHISGKQTIRDEAVVDYALSERGFVAPLSVHHRHLIDDAIRTENLFTYGPFRVFAADSEIKFTPGGDPL